MLDHKSMIEDIDNAVLNDECETSEWEVMFLDNIREMSSLTEKQEAKLLEIHAAKVK